MLILITWIETAGSVDPDHLDRDSWRYDSGSRTDPVLGWEVIPRFLALTMILIWIMIMVPKPDPALGLIGLMIWLLTLLLTQIRILTLIVFLIRRLTYKWTRIKILYIDPDIAHDMSIYKNWIRTKIWIQADPRHRGHHGTLIRWYCKTPCA